MLHLRRRPSRPGAAASVQRHPHTRAFRHLWVRICDWQRRGDEERGLATGGTGTESASVEEGGALRREEEKKELTVEEEEDGVGHESDT